jgi:hypothetical protein
MYEAAKGNLCTQAEKASVDKHTALEAAVRERRVVESLGILQVWCNITEDL